ncbi:hypothetical protein ABKN59_002404 [Abortiporus biennis]
MSSINSSMKKKASQRASSKRAVAFIPRRVYGFRIDHTATLESKAKKEAFVPAPEETCEKMVMMQVIEEYIAGVLIEEAPWASHEVVWDGYEKDAFVVYWRTNSGYRHKPHECQNFPNYKAIDDQQMSPTPEYPSTSSHSHQRL